jgi:hypothetical protein
MILFRHWRIGFYAQGDQSIQILAALAAKRPRLAENAEALATGAVPLFNRLGAAARPGYA